MSLRKYASFQTLATAVASGPDRAGLRARLGHRAVFEYTPREGYLYIRSRAISSRTNDNYDEFPAEEIKKAYLSFIGKPVFVNHHNEDHTKARGVMIDAALHEDTNPDGTPDTWAEVLMEVDAVSYPRLAAAMIAREVERTSMGCDVEYSQCTYCGNKATTPSTYCQHIPQQKGKRITREGKAVLVAERCYGLSFFENSLLVEPPADPTAYTFGLDTRGVEADPKFASLVRQANQRTASKTGAGWNSVRPPSPMPRDIIPSRPGANPRDETYSQLFQRLLEMDEHPQREHTKDPSVWPNHSGDSGYAPPGSYDHWVDDDVHDEVPLARAARLVRLAMAMPEGWTIEHMRNLKKNLKPIRENLDAQGLDEMHPMRGVTNYETVHGTHMAIVRDPQGNVVHATDYTPNKGSRDLWIQNVHTLESARGSGAGKAVMYDLAAIAHGFGARKGLEACEPSMSVSSAVPSAVGFYEKAGARFENPHMPTYGQWTRMDLERIVGAPTKGARPTAEQLDNAGRDEHGNNTLNIEWAPVIPTMTNVIYNQASRTAASGYTIKTHDRTNDSRNNFGTVEAYQGDTKVGELTWKKRSGYIDDLYVHKDHQRKGLATQMLAEGRKHGPIKHSTDLSPDGKAFSQATASKTASTPWTFDYMHNPVSSKSFGVTGGYGQDLEPSGRYVTEAPSGVKAPEGWHTGSLTFNQPLHLPFGGTYGDESNWKARLSARYEGKTGKALSAAVRADGFDGIVTHDKYGTSEIVDLTGSAKKASVMTPLQRAGSILAAEKRDVWKAITDGPGAVQKIYDNVSTKEQGEFRDHAFDMDKERARKEREEMKKQFSEGNEWKPSNDLGWGKVKPKASRTANTYPLPMPDDPLAATQFCLDYAKGTTDRLHNVKVPQMPESEGYMDAFTLESDLRSINYVTSMLKRLAALTGKTAGSAEDRANCDQCVFNAKASILENWEESGENWDEAKLLAYAKDYAAEGVTESCSEHAGSHGAYTASRRTAFGEQVAPSPVDTLRQDSCQVCGEQNSYDGEKCQVCGFIKPPDKFGDPDLSKAKENDLRGGDTEDGGSEVKQGLECDSCGAQFPQNEGQAAVAAPDPLSSPKTGMAKRIGPGVYQHGEFRIEQANPYGDSDGYSSRGEWHLYHDPKETGGGDYWDTYGSKRDALEEAKDATDHPETWKQASKTAAWFEDDYVIKHCPSCKSHPGLVFNKVCPSCWRTAKELFDREEPEFTDYTYRMPGLFGLGSKSAVFQSTAPTGYMRDVFGMYGPNENIKNVDGPDDDDDDDDTQNEWVPSARKRSALVMAGSMIRTMSGTGDTPVQRAAALVALAETEKDGNDAGKAVTNAPDIADKKPDPTENTTSAEGDTCPTCGEGTLHTVDLNTAEGGDGAQADIPIPGDDADGTDQDNAAQPDSDEPMTGQDNSAGGLANEGDSDLGDPAPEEEQDNPGSDAAPMEQGDGPEQDQDGDGIANADDEDFVDGGPLEAGDDLDAAAPDDVVDTDGDGLGDEVASDLQDDGESNDSDAGDLPDPDAGEDDGDGDADDGADDDSDDPDDGDSDEDEDDDKPDFLKKKTSLGRSAALLAALGGDPQVPFV